MVTLLNQTPLFEWYIARLVLENRHSKDTCHNDIGLCAQNIDTFLGSIVNTFVRVYVFTQRGIESSLWPPITFAFQFRFSNVE